MKSRKTNIMEGNQHPRYEVVDRDGRVIGFAVCNLELEEPQKPAVRKVQPPEKNLPEGEVRWD